MKHIFRIAPLAVATLLCFSNATVDASIVCNVFNSGDNVKFVANGNITTLGLTKTTTISGVSQVIPHSPFLSFQNGRADLYKFSQASQSQNFGAGTTIHYPDVNKSNHVFGLANNPKSGYTGTFLVVPENYQSQGKLHGDLTFYNTTIAAMGIKEGNFKWDLPNGQYFQMKIGNLGGAETPEPTTALIWSMLAGVGLVTRRRRG